MGVKTIDKHGRVETSYLDTGPQATRPAGMGCGPSGCGMGAVPGGPRFSRATAVSLASGALGGDRAARFALEAFRIQNPPRSAPPRASAPQGVVRPAGLGASSSVAQASDNGDGTCWVQLSDGTIYSQWQGQCPAVGDAYGSSAPGTSSGWRPVSRNSAGQWLDSSGNTAPGVENQAPGTTFQDVVRDAGQVVGTVAPLATKGYSIYRQVTGQQQPPPRQTQQPPSAGLSTGAMVGLGVGALALVTLVAIAATRGGSVRKNPRPRVSFRRVRANRYAHLLRRKSA